MTTFAVRNKLMELVYDNVKAYGIANEFVQDNEERLSVYIRCWNRAQISNSTEPMMTQRASIAKDEAGQIWNQVFV